MGCPFDGKCRDDCETCTDERIKDKYAALIDEAMNLLDELYTGERLRFLRARVKLLRSGV
jgi:hypothetical protein